MARTLPRVAVMAAGVLVVVGACSPGGEASDQRTVEPPPPCGVPVDAERVGSLMTGSFQIAGEPGISRFAGVSYQDVDADHYRWKVKVAIVADGPGLGFGAYDATGKLADTSMDLVQGTTGSCLTYTVMPGTAVEVRIGPGVTTDPANPNLTSFTKPGSRGNPADVKDLYQYMPTGAATQLPRR